MDLFQCMKGAAATAWNAPFHIFAAYFASLVVTYFILVSIYRITLHPLAKYPGPFLYKISNWPLIFRCIGGNRHIHHLLEHEKYGSIVRIGPNMLSFNTETALNTIYGSQKTNVRKSEWYRTMDAGSGAFSTATEIDKRRHAVRRRFIAHCFSASALSSAEPFIISNVKKFCDLVKPKAGSEWSEKKDMSVWCTWLGFDIMGELAFGKEFNCLEEDENRYISRAIISAAKYMYWFPFLPFAWLLAPLMNTKFMTLIGGQPVRDNIRLVEYGSAQLSHKTSAERAALAANQPPRKDMLHFLLNARDPKTGTGLSPTELLADSVLFIAAGADTVATSLAASFFYLTHHPRALHAAQSEVRAAFASAEDIRTGKALEGCVYLDAVMHESLRRAPPMPSHVPREVLPGGIVIDGELIPAGVVVGVPAYAIHHNPAYYPDPWAFSPERWIAGPGTSTSIGGGENENEKEKGEEKEGGGEDSGKDGRDTLTLARRAFCPFSLGVRGCIGKDLAVREYKLALAHVLWRFDIRLAAGETLGEGGPGLEEGRRRVDEWQMVDCMGVMREGPLAEFRVREGASGGGSLGE